MMDSLLLSEIMAEQKRRDIETRIKQGHVAELAGAAAIRESLRATVAAAIVRFGIMLDGAAGRRAAAHQL